MKKRLLLYPLYILAYGGWYLLSLLPFRVLYVLSDVLYLLAAKVLRYRHRVIWNNLTTSFPEKTEAELRDIERRFYHAFCDYLVETIKLMTMRPAQLQRRLQFKNTDDMNQRLASGQSVAVYLGHIFNWEWITSLPYWVPEGVQCCELYHPLENEYFDRLFKFVRERQHALCIPMQESLRKILEFKRNNRSIVVGYISDQVPMWNNIHHWIDFFHHDTPVLTGAERIVRHTDQACYYGDVRRVKRGYYEVVLKPISAHPAKEPEFAITDAYFKMLEENIRRQPELWLWSHNRWKRTREEFDRDWEVKGDKVVRRHHQQS